MRPIRSSTAATDPIVDAAVTDPATVDPIVDPASVDVDPIVESVVESLATDPIVEPTAASRWTVVDGVATATAAPGESLDVTIRFNAATNSVELVAADGTVDSVSLEGVTSVAIAGGAGDDTLTVSTAGGSLPVPVAFDGGAGDDTIGGPTADTTWTVSGSGSGSVAGVTFSGAESLRGAANNNDTFVVARGWVHPTRRWLRRRIRQPRPRRLVRHRRVRRLRPERRHRDVDGATIRYAGLEPITLTTHGAPKVVVDGYSASSDTITIRAELARPNIDVVGDLIDDGEFRCARVSCRLTVERSGATHRPAAARRDHHRGGFCNLGAANFTVDRLGSRSPSISTASMTRPTTPVRSRFTAAGLQNGIDTVDLLEYSSLAPTAAR